VCRKRSLQFAWALAVTCYAHHLGHFLHALGLHEYAHTGFMSWLGTPLVGGAIGAAAILGPGRKLLADGFLSFMRGNPNMNSLISLGATTSFSAGLLSAFLPDLSIDPSFLEEPVMLLAFVLLGRSLERKARKEASSDLISLVNLLPSHGRLVKDELSADDKCDDLNYISIPSSMIRRGDVIQVLPGETIPVDGNILRGSCSVDESLLTGESRTVLKQPGDSVIGGTILFDSPILVKTTTTGDLSTLSRIGQLVSEAQGREAPVQRLADRVAGWFCYGVMSASAMTFGFWYNFGLQLFPNLIYSDVMADMNGSFALLSTKLAIDVLVVACPCALGLATPTAVLVSSSAAAKRGILVKGGQILERMADVTSIVLDKTGTITNGNMKVLSVSNFSDGGNDPVRLAATAETQTIHPIASALREYAANNGTMIVLNLLGNWHLFTSNRLLCRNFPRKDRKLHNYTRQWRRR
jgi:P-type Cu+ transporter